jgi:hypothetical protein
MRTKLKRARTESEPETEASARLMRCERASAPTRQGGDALPF